MTTATAMESTAAAVEASSTAMESAPDATAATEALRAAANESATATGIPTVVSAGITATIPAAVSTMVSVAPAIAISTAEADPAIAIPAVPGPDADEQAAIEPLRPIVPIGRAGIRRRVVVAPLTYRSRPIIASAIHRPADPHANRNLSMGERRRDHQNSENRKQPEITHKSFSPEAPASYPLLLLLIQTRTKVESCGFQNPASNG
jgi:hypothetical protein